MSRFLYTKAMLVRLPVLFKTGTIPTTPHDQGPVGDTREWYSLWKCDDIYHSASGVLHAGSRV